jgi:hypothetical protein
MVIRLSFRQAILNGEHPHAKWSRLVKTPKCHQLALGMNLTALIGHPLVGRSFNHKQ